MTVYLVVYDGYLEGYGCEMYCAGVFDSKEKAEEVVQKIRKDYISNHTSPAELTYFDDNLKIKELKLNEELPRKLDKFKTYLETNCYIGGYTE